MGGTIEEGRHLLQEIREAAGSDGNPTLSVVTTGPVYHGIHCVELLDDPVAVICDLNDHQNEPAKVALMLDPRFGSEFCTF